MNENVRVLGVRASRDARVTSQEGWFQQGQAYLCYRKFLQNQIEKNESRRAPIGGDVISISIACIFLLRYNRYIRNVSFR